MTTKLFAGFLPSFLSSKAPAEDRAAALEMALEAIQEIAGNAAKRNGLWVHNEALAKILTIAEEVKCTT
jgi:hypothetical protein